MNEAVHENAQLIFALFSVLLSLQLMSRQWRRLIFVSVFFEKQCSHASVELKLNECILESYTAFSLACLLNRSIYIKRKIEMEY